MALPPYITTHPSSGKVQYWEDSKKPQRVSLRIRRTTQWAFDPVPRRYVQHVHLLAVECIDLRLLVCLNGQGQFSGSDRTCPGAQSNAEWLPRYLRGGLDIDTYVMSPRIHSPQPKRARHTCTLTRVEVTPPRLPSSYLAQAIAHSASASEPEQLPGPMQKGGDHPDS